MRVSLATLWMASLLMATGGRVSDASPVIGAAQWWHGWSDTDFDQLAGALIAGHLIECSAYVTGANFAGFDRFPVERFVDIPFGIVEVHEDGTHVVTKHDNTNGLVSSDTVKCQLLYELQGNIYLHSDVKADIANILVEDVGNNRWAFNPNIYLQKLMAVQGACERN